MHRRRGGKIFSLSRNIQSRTNATATKQAVSAHTLCQRAQLLHTLTRCFTQVSARPNVWDIPNSRSTALPSPLTTSTPADLGKWAPPISKWAKPESPEPSTKKETQNKPAPRGQSQQTFLRPNRGPRAQLYVSFVPPRGGPALGKWSRPPGFVSPKPTHSTSAKSSDPPKSLKVGERSSRTDFRRGREPRIGESSRSFIQPREDERAARQHRRWEGNGMHKGRGSLLSRRRYDVVPRQPRVHDVMATSKPKVRKAKGSLRVNPDINIPSTVSVGNFARLLNVSLGKVLRSSDRGID